MSPYQGDSPSDQGEPQPQQRGYEQWSTRTGQPGEYRQSSQAGGHQQSGQPGGYQQSGQPGGYQQSGQPGGHQQSGRPGGFEQTRQQQPSQFGSSQWGSQGAQQGGQRGSGQGAQQPTSGGQGGYSQQGGGGYSGQGQPGYTPQRQGGQQGGQGSFQQPGAQQGATRGSQHQQSSFQQPGGGGSQYAGTQAAGQGATGQQGYGTQGGMGTQQPMATQGMGGQQLGAQQVGDRGTTRRRPGPQLRPVTVEEIVQGDPVTAERDTPVSEIVAKMAEEDVGSVIVVDDERPIGIVTDRKIAMAIDGETVAELVAEDLVSGDLVTTTPEDSVFEVLRMLRDEGVRRLPVVDEDGSLQGIVTLDDLIVLLATEIGNVGEVVQAQIDRL